VSIDREINSRVDAFGSNPQALQKRYSMTKELVDLLALQKIKKDMDSARASVEAQMQTNPATIKQQREQEIFGRTAQDVAQQVGGALQTAQNQKQMAQRRPAPQGLGALMPQQGQRPQQPQRMQAGGIVAFDAGGAVETLFGEQGAILPLGLDKNSSIRDRIQYAIDTNVPLSRFSTEQLQTLRSDNNQYTPKIEAELARRQPEPKTEDTPPPVEPKPPTSDQTGGIAAVAKPKIPTAEDALVLRDQQNVPAGTAPSGTAGTAPSGTAGIAPPKLQGYDLAAGLESVGDAPAPVMISREGLEKPGVDFTKAYGVDPASIDPKAEGVAALKAAEDYYGVGKKDAEARQGLADLAALDASQTDPDKLRRDRLKAFLLGGANRGSSALAASGAASANLGRAQERDVRARQIKRNEMLRTIQDKDTEVRKLAKGEEKAAMERADRIKMDGLQIISNMSNAELSARQTEARVINESNIAGYQQKIQRVELLMEDAQNKLDNAIEKAKLESMDASRRGQIANAGIDDAMRRMTEVDKILSGVYQSQVEADTVLRNLNMQLAGADNEADMQKLKDQIENRQKEIKGSLAISHGNLYDEMDSLNSKILSLESMRNSALGGSSPNIALNPQDKSLIDMFSSMPQ